MSENTFSGLTALSVRKNREVWGPLQNTALYQKVLAFVEIYCWRFIDLRDKY